MQTALSLSPLFRQTVGFDRLNDLFESLSQGEDNSGYPPYNIERRGEDNYIITMAVAGFNERDLNITVQNDRISVTGRIENKENSNEDVQFLHRGIATRAFERSFHLADYMKVGAAELKDGLLRIQLQREIPEEAKPRMIPINSNNNSTKTIEGKHSKKAS